MEYIDIYSISHKHLVILYTNEVVFQIFYFVNNERCPTSAEKNSFSCLIFPLTTFPNRFQAVAPRGGSDLHQITDVNFFSQIFLCHFCVPSRLKGSNMLELQETGVWFTSWSLRQSNIVVVASAFDPGCYEQPCSILEARVSQWFRPFSIWTVSSVQYSHLYFYVCVFHE